MLYEVITAVVSATPTALSVPAAVVSDDVDSVVSEAVLLVSAASATVVSVAVFSVAVLSAVSVPFVSFAASSVTILLISGSLYDTS